jgi:hypothetical protein
MSKKKNPSVVVYACHPSNCGKYKIGGSQSRSALAKSETLFPKYPEQKGLEVEAWLKW